MDIGPHLVFSRTYNIEPLIVRAYKQKWIVYYQESPGRVFLASKEEDVIAYLKLLFLSKEVPFSFTVWDMHCVLGDGTTQSSTFGCGEQKSIGYDDKEQTDSRISVLVHAITSGFTLLRGQSKFVDREIEEVHEEWTDAIYDQKDE